MFSFHRAAHEGRDAVEVDSASMDIPREFLDRLPGGLFRCRADDAQTFDYVSSGLLALCGCADYDEFQALTGNGFTGLVAGEDRERVGEEIASQLAEGDEVHVRYRLNRADGEERWVEDWGHLAKDAEGARWMYGTIMDNTDQVRAEQALIRANERLEILTALSNDVVFDIKCATGEAHVFGDFEGRFGRAPQQPDFVVHRRCQKPCELEIKSHDLSNLIANIGEDSLVDFETSTEGPDGEPIWYRYQSVVLYGEDGGPVRHVGRLLDTNEAAQRESRFRHKAERDSLTGLYNRAAALDRIQTALNTEARPCTLITVDVDDFKAVNDHYGHPEGDYVLKQLAEFLSQVMRKEDIVARMGGDEFVVFAPGLAPGPAMERVLEHLARGPFATQRSTDGAAVHAKESGGPHHAAPSISVGAACCLTPPVDFDLLYEAADATLYRSKEEGKARYNLTVIG